jgi:ADP-ribose pyrophosphatase YjhB (NUDIX family)
MTTLLQAYRYCPYCGARLASANAIGDRPAGVRCVVCGGEVYANPLPTAAAVIVRRGKLLLGRRAVEPYAGAYSLPGGFIEEGESAEEALEREVREETSLHVTSADLLGLYLDRYPYQGVERWCICAAYAVEARGEPVAASDVADLLWCNVDALPEAMPFDSNRMAIADALARRRPKQQRR